MIGPGDVVVCVEPFSNFDQAHTYYLYGDMPNKLPQVGSLYRVVHISVTVDNGTEHVGLHLRECEPKWAFTITRFRKVEKGQDVFELVKKKDAPKELEPA